MTIIGIVGTACSGKETLVNLLVNKYGYKHINLTKYSLHDTLKLDNNTEPEDNTKKVENCIIDITSNNYSINTDIDDQKEQNKDLNKIGNNSFNIKLFQLLLSNWKYNYVISPITKESELEILQKTSFFLLSIDDSTSSRFIKYCNKYHNIEHKHTNNLLNEDIYKYYLNNEYLKNILFEFLVYENKKSDYSIRKLMNNADYHLYGYENIQDLENKLININIPNIIHRPSWDEYFMKLAWLTSKRSNCIRRKVGSVLVKNNRIISTGYNGTPTATTNCFEGGCIRCTNINVINGTNLEYCNCIHAESNVLFYAGKDKCEDSILYVTCLPCLTCAKHIIQCGIIKVIYSTKYLMDENRPTSIDILHNSNVEVIQFHNSSKFI
ncbi:cytidine/deoxycytidylate deaminase family protein [Cryptosporidium muris RN66]|uniref:dCMP deaminase n=1 Tax=Cryptosporidium muris (strain RN66) TaxID=441375 RepID=B6AHA2_CRYMR|nr:cytidine/deoxycytidylate deaminase family protein [Cryptosporidium muris RN66]EEA07597.1 cytidine/deoxycytidylate deaminase family protein [Cryptosporidium muris RN66]|eukprot:XP_002141946.1 cytidine/deoxycytidylate deaminase family protein [Cryptosporidium muris RN66]